MVPDHSGAWKKNKTSLNPPEGDPSTGNIPLPLTYLNHGLKLNRRGTASMTHCQIELMASLSRRLWLLCGWKATLGMHNKYTDLWCWSEARIDTTVTWCHLDSRQNLPPLHHLLIYSWISIPSVGHFQTLVLSCMHVHKNVSMSAFILKCIRTHAIPFQQGMIFWAGPRWGSSATPPFCRPLLAAVSVCSRYRFLLLLPPTPTLVWGFDSIPSPTPQP